jgi:calcineurin-like phosphoesterase family protein
MEMKIKLEKEQKLFFTSDTHYNHKNLCRGVTNWRDINGEIPVTQTRSFNTLEQMNDNIVASLNHLVGEDDILIHLGDFSFGGFDNIGIFRNRIICKNIHLILGNHDHHIERNKGGVKDFFKSVNQTLTLEVEMYKESKKDSKIVHTFELSHYPISSWKNMNDGVIHLHGHVHLGPEVRMSNTNKGRYMDVGMDGNNMNPISMEEVLKLLGGKEVGKLSLPSDHHEERLKS